MTTNIDKIIVEIKDTIKDNKYEKEKHSTLLKLREIAKFQRDIKRAEESLAEYITQEKIPEELIKESSAMEVCEIDKLLSKYQPPLIDSSYIYGEFTGTSITSACHTNICIP